MWVGKRVINLVPVWCVHVSWLKLINLLRCLLSCWELRGYDPFVYCLVPLHRARVVSQCWGLGWGRGGIAVRYRALLLLLLLLLLLWRRLLTLRWRWWGYPRTYSPECICWKWGDTQNRVFVLFYLLFWATRFVSFSDEVRIVIIRRYCSDPLLEHLYHTFFRFVCGLYL